MGREDPFASNGGGCPGRITVALFGQQSAVLDGKESPGRLKALCIGLRLPLKHYTVTL